MFQKFNVLVLVFLALALGLAACTPQVSEPELVEVTLTEFGIQSTQTQFEAGQPYRFVIRNSGALAHEFTVMPAGMTAPTQEMESMHHNMTGAMLHVGVDQLPVGAVVTVEFTFTEAARLGELEFACHLPGHYEAGMFNPIVVNA